MYRIKDWALHYENAESRKIKGARWIPIPNKHDGKGFRRLTRLGRKVEIFCAWTLILQVASKCPVRGTLGDENGPLTALDLEDMTGFPEEIFTLAFEALTSEKIGWIEICQDKTSIHREETAISPGTPGQPPDKSTFPGNEGIEGREGREEEKKRSSLPPLRAEISAYGPEVSAVLRAYPKKREREGGRVESVHVGEADRSRVLAFLQEHPDYPLLDAVKLYDKSTKRPKDLRTWLENPTAIETVQKGVEAARLRAAPAPPPVDTGPIATQEEISRMTSEVLERLNGRHHPAVRERLAVHA